MSNNHTMINQWRKDGRHLPEFMRDFHDQKNLFRTIHEKYQLDQIRRSIPPIDWVQAHVYTIDAFLWFLAAHGWTLQRNATKRFTFYSIETALERAQEARDDADIALLKAALGKE